MIIFLKEELFENNEYIVQYGNREAKFTIVDEEFAGNNRLGRINRIVIMVREFNNLNVEVGATTCVGVIGMGDGIVGIHCDDRRLLGQPFTRDNMAACSVELYEAA